MATRAILNKFLLLINNAIDLFENNLLIKAICIILICTFIFNIFYVFGTKLGKFIRNVKHWQSHLK